jgi:excinuclease ABC subunit C
MVMTKAELLGKANDLPLAPGVYLMMDKAGKVIYVGKAKKLKNRVSQYFQENSSHNFKTRTMVSQVDHFDTIFVTSEFEALVLENSLIKQHMPRYNILLKDDKGYPFIRLETGVDYPKFSLAGRAAHDKARYFGPFGGRGETRQALSAVLSALHMPTCAHRFPRDIGKERPCLNFHMGRCDGFCRGTPDGAEYRRRIAQAVDLLSGKYRQLSRELEREMTAAADALQFEQAAALRDRLKAVSVLGKTQQVIAGVCADTDVWGLYRGAAKCGYAVLHVEDGNLLGRDVEVFTAPTEETDGAVLSAVLSQYYLPRSVFPSEILLPAEVEELDSFIAVLTQKAGHRVTLRLPQRGERAELLRMAQRNAQEDVERVTSDAERSSRTLAALAQMAGLSAPPERMESYDISNTGSADMVASMVVYAGVRPLKRDYRRFQIKSLDHPDDYHAMQEVLTRRVERFLSGDVKFSPLPDVFLIDGGQTHARAALEVLSSHGLAVPVFGMVKDDRHRTRALMTPDGREIGIAANPAVFSLIGQIQEETHRFAITYHHEKHTRSTLKSALDGIPGVGSVRKKLLLKTFLSVRGVREATLDQLTAVLPRDAAIGVYRHFHEEETS